MLGCSVDIWVAAWVQTPCLKLAPSPSSADEPAHSVPMYSFLFFPVYYFPSIMNTPAMQHTCATSCMTPMSLCNHLLTPLTLVGPINQSHHWTSFAYGMYRWPMDVTVTFSFLDWSPCCFSDDYFFFWLTNSPPWYVTALLSYPTHPDTGQPVSSHCAMWSVSQGTVAISPQMILVLVFPWQVFLYLITCIFCTQQRSFPLEFGLSKTPQSGFLHTLLSNHTFTLPHLTL